MYHVESMMSGYNDSVLKLDLCIVAYLLFPWNRRLGLFWFSSLRCRDSLTTLQNLATCTKLSLLRCDLNFVDLKFLPLPVLQSGRKLLIT